ncbi:terminase small subunit [Cypionkella sp. TWP1-2-1b2]|uniref:terminase small subunit n=1 Tax=Cypionkella sp. TWP1-2-1b2 TaxID=2804675 RepID=UPI003CE78119
MLQYNTIQTRGDAMSKGLTAKQEAFCLAYIETGNASEAYRLAYDVGENTKPETIWRKASALATNGKVSARVAELKGQAATRLMVTLESLTTELDEARKVAKETLNPAAMTGATMGKAKLHGLLVDKQEAHVFSITISGDDADL